MRDLIKHRTFGVAFVGMMLLGVWLVNAIFTQKFTSFSEVALNTDTAGLNLPARADVKVRGEIIGQVLGLGFLTRYSGTDAVLGLAFTGAGVMYPFFAAYLGWLGVFLTGSDTASNALFGSLQKITAQQLGFNPTLIVTANSTGGVMGKMIDAQSIVVATASTGQVGQEGRILRFVFWHSLVLALLMGLLVMSQAYVWPGIIP